jgi:hypothetical protein
MRINKKISFRSNLHINGLPGLQDIITSISFTAYNFTAALTKQPSAFPIAAFPQPIAHSSFFKSHSSTKQGLSLLE